MKKITATSVDDYINTFPPDIAARLQEVRRIIRETVPEAWEGISYHMPAYKLLGKPLSYFAAHNTHLGFYATPSSHEAFAEELSAYVTGKGSVQFPYQHRLPTDLIRRMVAHRAGVIRKATKG